jgi:AraC-like DNA-binding protein
MPTPLTQIKNWPELARQANGSVTALAKQCGVSVRTLERHFLKQMGKSPKVWLIEQQQDDAVEVLKKCTCIKEAAANLGYKHTQHFSRDFKAFWGYCPTEMIPPR